MQDLKHCPVCGGDDIQMRLFADGQIFDCCHCEFAMIKGDEVTEQHKVNHLWGTIRELRDEIEAINDRL